MSNMNRVLPRIIAICGHKRCGKDTLAEYISTTYGYEHLKISKKLKDVIQLLFNFSDEQIESDAKELIDPKWHITPRHAMQYVGTEMFQYDIQKLVPGVGRNFWIRSFIESHISATQKNIVISDLRFLHEYEELKKYGVYVVRINRASTFHQDTHCSETEFKSIPYNVSIENDGNISKLHEAFTMAAVNQTESHEAQ